MTLIKRLVARLPDAWQNELRRIHCRRQIRKGRFEPGEPEYELLPTLIREGDWVLDIGANIGEYTKRCSELVGTDGRVIALEPVPATFALLAANVQLFKRQNVTVLNLAASDRSEIVGMSIPRFSSGLPNYYEAHLSASPEDAVRKVLSVPIDSLVVGHRIALVKIDVEGHESAVLNGMASLLARDRPVLIVETRSADVVAHLGRLGYTGCRSGNSPNVVFRPTSSS